MKKIKVFHLATFAIFFFVAGSAVLRAQSTPPPASPNSQAQADRKGMVWVNTDTGVYHKPGTRWYGKTKRGKYMLEVDAQKAGYHPAEKK